MSDSNRLKIAYVEEAQWGVVPALAFNEMRVTGESLSHAIENVVSEEIRSDRQTTDLIQVAAQSNGDINFELTYGSYDAFLKAALFGAWSTPLAITGSDISFVESDNSVNSASNGFTAVVVGQWIKISGAGVAGNNGYGKVIVKTNAKLTLTGITLVDESAGEDITITGSMLRNGVAETSFVLEKQFLDASDKNFHLAKGMMVSDLSLTVDAQSIVTGSLSFLGKEQGVGNATSSTGAIVESNSNTPLNAVNNIGSVREGGTELTNVFLSSLGIELTNNLRGQNAIGHLGLIGIGVGRCEITGSISAYFEDGAMYQKYLDGATTSVDFRVQDVDGNVYIITLPRIKFEDGTVQAGGGNEDVFSELSYRAIRDPSSNCMIQIDKFAA